MILLPNCLNGAVVTVQLAAHLVAARAVPREVVALEGCEVHLLVTRVVVVQGARQAGPRALHARANGEWAGARECKLRASTIVRKLFSQCCS